MDYKASNVISKYLRQKNEIFTVEEFLNDLKSQGVRISMDEAEDILHSSNYVFPLIKHQYITKSGVFCGRWFSFKPSKEEVDKGAIILGHRCMPFYNPETPPDSIVLTTSEKTVESTVKSFSMNLALDVFALFGEGYVIPYIFNDKGNVELSLASVQYSLPVEINLTCWPIKEIAGNEKFEFGDRLLCRVVDWENSVVEVIVQKDCMKKMMVSGEAIEREEWYGHFEQALLESFDKHGPAGSIEEQLSLLILENQEDLCIPNCGSIEEFLGHTTKVGFEMYGVEGRIWRRGEVIPYTGSWNSNVSSKELIMTEIAMAFSPAITDAYLEDNIYESEKKGKSRDVEEIIQELFPQILKMDTLEKKILLLNLEKRNDILKKNYNKFSDYSIADIRKRVIKLFTQVNGLFCTIGGAGIKIEDFPQQELVILSQLFAHLVRLLEELENVFARSELPLSDLRLSLEGMEETFDDIKGTLKDSLESNSYKSFEIVNKD